MTVASLILEIGANTAGLRKELTQSSVLLQEFTRNANFSRQFSKSLGSGFVAAELSVKDFLQTTQNSFNRFTSANRENFARGLISPETFRKNGLDAIRAFDQTLLSGLSDMRSRFGQSLTRGLEQQITDSFKGLGLKGADAFNQSMAQRLVSTGDSFSKAGDSLTRLGKRATIGLTLPLGFAVVEFAKFGAQADAASQKLDLTFGPTAERIRIGIENLRKTIPATTREVTQFVDMFGEMLLNMGLGREKAATMSLELVRVAGALALFRNRSPEEALVAVRSAVNGLTRPLRDFGVYFSQNDIKIEAQRMHLLAHNQVMTSSIRVLAAYSLIQKNSTIQQALANELAQTAAVRFKFMGSNIREARDIIGQQMLPVLGPLAEEISRLAIAIGKLDPWIIKFAFHLTLLAIAIGPVTTLLGFLSSGIGLLIKIVGVLMGPSALAGLGALLTPAGWVMLGLVALAAITLVIYEHMNKVTQATKDFQASLTGLDDKALAGIQHSQEVLLTSARWKLNAVGPVGWFDTAGQKKKAAIIMEIKQFQKNVDDVVAARKKLAQASHPEIQIQPPAAVFRESTREPKTLLDVLDARENVLRATLKGASATGFGFDALIRQAANYRDEMVQLGVTNQDTAMMEIAHAKTLDEQVKAYQDLAQAIGVVSNAQDLFNDVMKAAQEQRIKTALTPLVSAGAQFQDLGAQPFGGLNVDIQAARNVRLAADTTSQALEGLFSKGLITGEQFRKALSDIHELMVKLGLVTDKDAIKFKKFENEIKALQSASKALAGLSDLAGAFNLDEMQQTLTAASHLADNIASVLANPHDIGAWVGSISSAVGLVKSLFSGNDEVARSIHDALSKNSDRLAELNQTMRGFNANAVGNQSNVGKALTDFVKAFNTNGKLKFDFNQFQGLSGGKGLQGQIDLLAPFLKDLGVSFNDLKDVAKSLGIDIFDKNGRLIEGALVQLIDAIELNTKIITTFNDRSLQDLRDQTAITNAINGTADTAAQRWKDSIAILTQLAPNIGNRFAGVDVSTVAGQNLARQIMQQILAEIKAGTLSKADFGDLQGLAELISLFTPMADSLNEMKDAVDGVNQSLEGVPTGFKLALATFDAMTSENRPTTAASFGGGSPWETKQPLAGGLPVTQQVTMHFGDIILPPSDVTPREQAKGIIREAMNIANEQFGRPDYWSKLMVT